MDKAINVLSLFDGISCAQIALQRAGISVNNYFSSEIDKNAINVTQHNWPNTVQLGDVNKWREWDIDWESIDLLCAGFPCFAKGTKIITDKGYKNIEEITIKDYVLTHKNRYRRVLNTQKKKNYIWKLKAHGCLETNTTEEHPYYIREMSRVWDKNEKKLKRILSEPKWKNVSNLNVNTDFVGLPIIKIEENPRNLTPELCWFFGRYAADGYCLDSKRSNRNNSCNYKIVICVGKHKSDEFEGKIKTLKYTKAEEKSVLKYYFSSMELLSLFKNVGFGRRAENKVIPQEVLHLTNELAKSFLDGYMSGDGSFSNGKFKATSISKELCMGLNLLVAKIYKVNSGIVYTQRPKTTIIEGRVVNQKDTYSVDFFTEIKKQSNAIIDENFVWLPVKKVEKTNIFEDVYNFEVEDDNSYTANNVVVHNCQSWSFSGKQKGINDPRGALAIILSEIFFFLKEKNPNLKFLFENVKMKKEYLNYLNNLFGIEAIEIDSALVSAQHRKRLYWTNIEGVTLPADKGILLKDILETDAKFEFVHNDIYKSGRKRGISWQYDVSGKGYNSQTSRAFFLDGKAGSLSHGAPHATKILTQEGVRKTTRNEHERLQTLPDNYTLTISLNKAKSAIGNGWTVDIIAHIFSFLPEKFKNK